MNYQNIIIVIILLFLYLFFQKKKFTKFFLLLSVSFSLMPGFYISNQIKIPFHYLFLLLVTIMVIKNIKNYKIIKDKTCYLFFRIFILFLGIINTYFFIQDYSNSPFLPIISNFSNIIIYVFLLKYILEINFNDIIKVISNYILIVNILNIFASIIQLAFGKIDFFYNLYYSSSNATLQYVKDIGFFSRGFGFYYSTVIYGVEIVFSFSILLYIKSFISNKKFVNIYILLCINVVLSLSKTAIFGSIIINLLFLIINNIFYNKKYKIKNFLVSFLVIPLLIISIYLIYSILSKTNLPIDYYFNIDTLIRGIRIRYSSEATALKDTYNIIKEYPFGSGYAPIRGEFIGDSDITTLLKNSGILALLGYTIFYIYNLFLIFRKKKYVLSIVLISFFLGGLALPSLISYNVLMYFLFYNYLLNYDRSYQNE